ncbi:hypothetical protein [Kushneria phyllosphaerae]|uniref:Uncharacterized protein n=1 Tax=Kushneria phyllosphaerae TaxID=2100822 RepID=A0A2R8CKJ4_9GAMM|nr:hypothetical protein [Kushneria phyllosphaerae]SPJ33427.1 hypothetical protein KSP9073_01436 [Kushneria phyllosphaerae]
MKTPFSITLFILICGAIATCFISNTCISLSDKIGHTITLSASVGTMIAASFAIYAYWINLRAFKVSQKPKIRIAALNGQGNVVDNNVLVAENVHQTLFDYKNLGSVDCEKLKLKAQIDFGDGYQKIPNLFEEHYLLQAEDDRARRIPTLRFLQNQFPNTNIEKAIIGSKLKFECCFSSLDGKEKKSLEYIWSEFGWQIL